MYLFIYFLHYTNNCLHIMNKNKKDLMDWFNTSPLAYKEKRGEENTAQTNNPHLWTFYFSLMKEILTK